MIKKLLSVLFVAACAFGVTSCTSDEFTTTQSGDEATVSFSLGLEGGIRSEERRVGKECR